MVAEYLRNVFLEEALRTKSGEDLSENSNVTRPQKNKIDLDQVKSKLYPNDIQEYVGEIKSGKKQGLQVQYSPNGTIGNVDNIDYGRINGTGKLYYTNGNERILFNGTFVGGEIKDGFIFGSNGKIIKKIS